MYLHKIHYFNSFLRHKEKIPILTGIYAHKAGERIEVLVWYFDAMEEMDWKLKTFRLLGLY